MPDHIRSTRCTVDRGAGEFCDAESAPDMPFPICARHALRLYRRMQEMLDGMDPQEKFDSLLILNVQALQEKVANEERAYLAKDHVVYYLRVGEYIKIGTTGDLAARLSGYPPGTELLAIEPGNWRIEQLRLRRFRTHLASGKEWFDPAPELLAHIAEVSRSAVSREAVKRRAS